jgi:glycosyltransferase involved in cell wall biosynthesis
VSLESLFTRHGRLTFTPIAGIVVIAQVVATMCVHQLTSNTAVLAIWWIGNARLLISVGAFFKGGRVPAQPIAPGRIVAIVTAYEHGADDLRACISSILEQGDVEVDEVHVVDDGSTLRPVEPFAHPRVRWHRTRHGGAHAAAGYVLDRLQPEDWDFVLLVGADCVLDQRSLERQLKAFSRTPVTATTWNMIAGNGQQNVLTRIVELNNGASSAMPSVRHSLTPSFTIISGAPVMYRARVAFQHRRRQLSAGGDDISRLAVYATLEGEVVGVSDAIARVPAAAGTRAVYHQRLAWSTSWWRLVRHASIRADWRRGVFSRLLALVHLVALPLTTCYALVAIALDIWREDQGWPVVALFAALYLLGRYAAAARYLIERPAISRRRKLGTWLLLTPAEAVGNLMFVIPIKYLALIRLCVRSRRARSGRRPVSSAASVVQLGAVYYSGHLLDGHGS